MIARVALLTALCAALAGPGPAVAQEAGAPAGAPAARPASAAEQAAQAASDLQAAILALEEAQSARDRVAALTETIGAYEAGLGALRESLRQAALRETALTLQFNAQRDRIAQLVGVLGQMEADPGPTLLLHPSGALGTVRSGMILADVTPALQAEAARLRSELAELRDLRALQLGAGEILARGLATAQTARTTLSQAISDRTDLPRRFVDDPEALRSLLESADTLQAFATGLAPDATDSEDFAAARGRLPWPVLGSILLRPDEADAAGIRRPGLTIATRPRALVTAPWPATIRYRGPLLDYGNVMILEPGGGYLLILAGLQTVFGETGEVVAQGAPLGLMGGEEAALADILSASDEGGSARESETLYLEMRQGAEPVDPEPWFAEGRD